MKASETLTQAVLAYQAGDDTAFQTIYDESSRYLYVCIKNIMKGNDNLEDICEDLLQETYVQIVKSIHTLKAAEKFLSWAGAVASSRCYKYIEKNKNYQLLKEDENPLEELAADEAFIPESVLDNCEQQRIIRAMIENELTQEQRLCVIGYYYQGLKQSELAEKLEIPENTVKTHLLRAKKKLRTAVESFEKKENIKLYTLAPILAVLFDTQVAECILPVKVSAAVLAECSAMSAAEKAAANVQQVKKAGKTGKKLAKMSIRQKAAAAAVTAAVAGGAVGAGVFSQKKPLEDIEYATYYIFADTSDADTSMKRDSDDVQAEFSENIFMEPEIYLLEEQVPLYSMEWVECGYTKSGIYARVYSGTESAFTQVHLCEEKEIKPGDVLFWIKTEDWEQAEKEIVDVEEQPVLEEQTIPASEQDNRERNGIQTWETVDEVPAGA